MSAKRGPPSAKLVSEILESDWMLENLTFFGSLNSRQAWRTASMGSTVIQGLPDK